MRRRNWPRALLAALNSRGRRDFAELPRTQALNQTTTVSTPLVWVCDQFQGPMLPHQADEINPEPTVKSIHPFRSEDEMVHPLLQTVGALQTVPRDARTGRTGQRVSWTRGGWIKAAKRTQTHPNAPWDWNMPYIYI